MNPALSLASARVVLGGVALASPDLAAKLFRLDGPGNPQLPYMTRMFASREILLGAATLMASGKVQRNLVLAGVAVDAADTYAAWQAGQDGVLDQPTTTALAAPAAAAALAGVVGVLGLRRNR